MEENMELNQFINTVIDQITGFELCNQLQTFDVLGASRPKLKDVKTTQFGPGKSVDILSKIVIEKDHLFDLTFEQILELTDYTDYFYAICFKAFGPKWSTYLDGGSRHNGYQWFLEDHWKYLQNPIIQGTSQGVKELSARHAARIVTLMAAKKLAADSNSGIAWDWPAYSDLLFVTDTFNDTARRRVEGMRSDQVPPSKYLQEHGSQLPKFKEKPIF